MRKEQRDFTTSPVPPRTIAHGMNKSSRMVRYEVTESMSTLDYIEVILFA